MFGCSDMMRGSPRRGAIFQCRRWIVCSARGALLCVYVDSAHALFDHGQKNENQRWCQRYGNAAWRICKNFKRYSVAARCSSAI